MKQLSLWVVGLMILGLAGFAGAKESGNKKNPIKPLVGVVVSVDEMKLKITKKAKTGQAAEDVVVATDDSTVVTIDAETKKLKDLTAGMRVRVTPATGTAMKIDATTKTKGDKTGKEKPVK